MSGGIFCTELQSSRASEFQSKFLLDLCHFAAMKLSCVRFLDYTIVSLGMTRREIMLDINIIRNNPGKIQQAAKAKRVDIDAQHILEIDAKYRELEIGRASCRERV